MNLFGVMDVSASALKAERVRAEVVASNMANAETTRTAEGGPYKRHHVLFGAQGEGSFGETMTAQMNSLGNFSNTSLSSNWINGLGGAATDSKDVPGGVAVTGVIEDESEPLRRYD